MWFRKIGSKSEWKIKTMYTSNSILMSLLIKSPSLIMHIVRVKEHHKNANKNAACVKRASIWHIIKCPNKKRARTNIL